jgi:hypothetical protein
MLGHLSDRKPRWPARLLGRLIAPEWYPRNLDWQGRKLRLLASACCRRVAAPLSDPRSLRAVEASERFADGLATADELVATGREAEAAFWEMVEADSDRAGGEAGPRDTRPVKRDAACLGALQAARASFQLGGEFGMQLALYQAAWAAAQALSSVPLVWRNREAKEPLRRAFAEQAGLIRELFANPCRPAPLVDPAWLAWQGGAVARLGRAAYDERRLPEGTLNPVRLALLADALEDAGCADAELLRHLRSPGPHVRGCWALDLILGKS